MFFFTIPGSVFPKPETLKQNTLCSHVEIHYKWDKQHTGTILFLSQLPSSCFPHAKLTSELYELAQVSRHCIHQPHWTRNRNGTAHLLQLSQASKPLLTQTPAYWEIQNYCIPYKIWQTRENRALKYPLKQAHNDRVGTQISILERSACKHVENTSWFPGWSTSHVDLTSPLFVSSFPSFLLKIKFPEVHNSLKTLQL